jgi:peptide/nickel transport system ATP-binding protein
LRLLADRPIRLSIIFVTDDLRVAAQICDRIAVMKDDAVLDEGMVDVFAAPRQV